MTDTKQVIENRQGEWEYLSRLSCPMTVSVHRGCTPRFWTAHRIDDGLYRFERGESWFEMSLLGLTDAERAAVDRMVDEKLPIEITWEENE